MEMKYMKCQSVRGYNVCENNENCHTRNLTCKMKYVPQCRLPDQEHANAGQHLQLSLHIEKSFVCWARGTLDLTLGLSKFPVVPALHDTC